jgi:hypothetical protein
MPSSLNGTGVTFNDGTQLNSANDAGGNYILRNITSPGTWTKPAGLKAVKVTVVGAGGNGGNGVSPNISDGGPGGGGGYAMRYIPAPSIPGPVTVTYGTAPSKTTSFGAFVSATGGGNGGNGTPTTSGTPGAGGSGSNGDINLTAAAGGQAGSPSGAAAFAYSIATTPSPSVPLRNGKLYGGGAVGGAAGAPPANPTAGGTGAAGLLIVEEFY